MKELIVAIALLPLLLIFPMQSILDTINDSKIEMFDSIVNEATKQARFDGYFTPANINHMKTRILADFDDLEESDIEIVVTDTPKYRTNVFDSRETINYDISIPINKIIAGGSILGIPDADNKYRYRKKSYVLSEVNMP